MRRARANPHCQLPKSYISPGRRLQRSSIRKTYGVNYLEIENEMHDLDNSIRDRILIMCTNHRLTNIKLNQNMYTGNSVKPPHN